MDTEQKPNEEQEEEFNDDLEFVGDSNMWKTLIKVWSNQEEWCDTTMAMEVPGGVILRTQYISDDGGNSSEALIHIPGVHLEKDADDRWMIK